MLIVDGNEIWDDWEYFGSENRDDGQYTGRWYCQTQDRHTWEEQLLFHQYHYYCKYCGRKRHPSLKTYRVIPRKGRGKGI